jgi:hypothetical protein
MRASAGRPNFLGAAKAIPVAQSRSYLGKRAVQLIAPFIRCEGAWRLPAIAPVLLGLNTAVTYLGVTTAGILGAVGIHLLGAHYLSFLSVGVFVLAIFTSHMAGRRIEDHRAADSLAAMQPVRS